MCNTLHQLIEHDSLGNFLTSDQQMSPVYWETLGWNLQTFRFTSTHPALSQCSSSEFMFCFIFKLYSTHLLPCGCNCQCNQGLAKYMLGVLLCVEQTLNQSHSTNRGLCWRQAVNVCDLWMSAGPDSIPICPIRELGGGQELHRGSCSDHLSCYCHPHFVVNNTFLPQSCGWTVPLEKVASLAPRNLLISAFITTSEGHCVQKLILQFLQDELHKNITIVSVSLSFKKYTWMWGHNIVSCCSCSTFYFGRKVTPPAASSTAICNRVWMERQILQNTFNTAKNHSLAPRCVPGNGAISITFTWEQRITKKTC